jgi:hypothetical protein
MTIPTPRPTVAALVVISALVVVVAMLAVGVAWWLGS